jgi:hypothetical protein
VLCHPMPKAEGTSHYRAFLLPRGKYSGKLAQEIM